ncbi:alpha/beta hydrolase [Halomonas nitroreducens]|uniref:Alpha/beta hydrolase n=1 Tax=Halomonas nitroreducens TaxID=447425 RepID=A0A431V674_9GAMM|nr:alpha/beta hydrolase [Halomonas nitroreducens]RTR04962.1 alpha/beta hydrolase [Halomonas nitroreducens]
MLKVAAGLLAAYSLVLLLAWAFQARLLYLPHVGREVMGTPTDIGLDWEAVRLRTSDDLTLAAWWIPAEPARATLLFFHGNAGNISHRLASIRQFHRLGLSVLIVDYRGYGESEGRPSEEGTARDARAAWQWLVEERGLAAEEIVLFGRSLGAGVAAELAASLPPGEGPGALILESAFRSVPKLGQRLYPFLPVRWLSRFEYDVERYVTQRSAPLLVIHSREDEIIPFGEGKAVYEAAREPKELLVIHGGHNTGFLDSEPEYSAGIAAFLDEHLETWRP